MFQKHITELGPGQIINKDSNQRINKTKYDTKWLIGPIYSVWEMHMNKENKIKFELK